MIDEYRAILIPQDPIPLDAGEDAFPEHVEKKCCPGKSCGNTSLHRAFGYDWNTGVRVYGYKRDSNDDWFFGPYDTLTQLAEEMNHPDFWPVDEEKRERYWEEQRAAGAYGPWEF